MKKKEAELLENILAAGGEIAGWQEVTDSKGDIHIIPRVRIDTSALLKLDMQYDLEAVAKQLGLGRHRKERK
jgi:hypothetical protein